MESLRQAPPETVGGQRVHSVVDYWDQQTFGRFVSDTDQLPRNVIQYFTDHFIITVRPSGTEPKLKFYCQLLPLSETLETRGLPLLVEARALADRVARLIYGELLARIDLSLTEAALRLPDIVDFDRKKDFGSRTAPHLREALAHARFGTLQEVLTWLSNETASMTPGADPLPALKAPLASLLGTWSEDLARTPLLNELQKWSKA